MTKRLTICFLFVVVALSTTAQEAYYSNLPVELKQVSLPQIPDRQLSLNDVGGVGDGVTPCTEAFEKAITQLTAQGGGRLMVPQGIWLTGPITLDNNIELHLDKNAIIYFSPDKRLYVETKKRSSRVRPCISADKKHDIAITGEGIIDGNGQQWRPVKRSKVSDVEWKLYKQMGGVERDNGQLWYPWAMVSGYPDIADSPEQQEKMRNDLVRMTDCQNLLFKGVTFQNAPKFHVHPCYWPATHQECAHQGSGRQHQDSGCSHSAAVAHNADYPGRTGHRG